MKPPKLLCITPIAHIGDLLQRMSSKFEVVYMPDPGESDLNDFDAEIIFTNPNKSKIYLGQSLLTKFRALKVIATASTGTVHIDKVYCENNGIKVISLTKEIKVLETITSTAEHAFLLTLAGVRHLLPACRSVDQGIWDYERFVGRQINCLKVGVLGFGRLGKMYAHFAYSFGAQVLVNDPYKDAEINESPYENVAVERLFKECDVVSLHIHATDQNRKFVSSSLLSLARNNLLLVNTARGEVVDDHALLEFLGTNPQARYYTDVLDNEFNGLSSNPLFKSSLYGERIFITPHIGGMSIDAQLIAYNHCYKMLCEYLGC